MRQFSLAKSFLYIVSVLAFTLSAFGGEGRTQALTIQNKRLEVAVARLLTTFPGSRYSEEQFLSAIQGNVDENGIIEGLIKPAQKLYEYYIENGYSEQAEYLDTYLQPTLTPFGDTYAGGFIKVKNVDHQGGGSVEKTGPTDRADKFAARNQEAKIQEPPAPPAKREASPAKREEASNSKPTEAEVNKCIGKCLKEVAKGAYEGAKEGFFIAGAGIAAIDNCTECGKKPDASK